MYNGAKLLIFTETTNFSAENPPFDGDCLGENRLSHRSPPNKTPKGTWALLTEKKNGQWRREKGGGIVSKKRSDFISTNSYSVEIKSDLFLQMILVGFSGLLFLLPLARIMRIGKFAKTALTAVAAPRQSLVFVREWGMNTKKRSLIAGMRLRMERENTFGKCVVISAKH